MFQTDQLRNGFSFGAGIIVFVAVVLMTGCAITMGAKFDASRVGEIQIGKSTKNQIQEMLGPPSSEGIKDGRPMWIYFFAQIRLFGTPSRGTLLTIEFDKEERVESYSYTPY